MSGSNPLLVLLSVLNNTPGLCKHLLRIYEFIKVIKNDLSEPAPSSCARINDTQQPAEVTNVFRTTGDGGLILYAAAEE